MQLNEDSYKFQYRTVNNLIPLTDIKTEEDTFRLPKEKTLCKPITLDLWESTYPELDATKIYYQDVYCRYALTYYDLDNLVYFELPMACDGSFRTGDAKINLDHILTTLSDIIENNKNRKYTFLEYAPKCIALEMVLLLAQKKNRKIMPDGDLCALFEETYISSDFGLKNIPVELVRNLFNSIPEAHKRRLREKIEEYIPTGPVTIYRGFGALSTPLNNCMSWTTDLQTAIFFGYKSGQSGAILKATVSSDNIEIYLNAREENEVLVFFENVNIVTQIVLPSGCDSIINFRTSSVAKTYSKYKTFIDMFFNDNKRLNWNHNIIHLYRVLMYCCIMADKLNIYDESLFVACCWHDVGRESDDFEDNHGASSKKAYNKDNKTVNYLLENHTIPYDDIDWNDATHKYENILLGILKDAIEIDKAKFGFNKYDINKLKNKELATSLIPYVMLICGQPIEELNCFE